MNDVELYRSFRDSVRSAFEFLENDYGCRVVEEEELPPHGTSITYANQTTGIKVDLQPREGYLTTYLIELDEGEVPLYLDFSTTHYAPIDAIAEAETGRDERPTGNLDDSSDVKRMVEEYAEMVREHGAEVLRGDLSKLRSAVARIHGEEDLLDVGI